MAGSGMVEVADGSPIEADLHVALDTANRERLGASVLAGVLHGIDKGLDPGDMVAEQSDYVAENRVLPSRWGQAIELCSASAVLPAYLGEQFHRAYVSMRRAEEEDFNAAISNLDYEWYLRAI